MQTKNYLLKEGLLLSIVLFFYLFLPMSIQAEEFSDYSLDLIPPEITIIQPLEDSVIDKEDFRIEIYFADNDSDIADQTISLFLDNTNITSQSVIENMDLTGQIKSSPRKISYSSKTRLTNGIHELYFSVRDNAGNLTEVRRSFTIKTTGPGGIRVNGTNFIQFSQFPIRQTTDILNLTFQQFHDESDLQLYLLGRATDYPGISPLYQYQNYNFFLDKYSLSYNQRNTTLALGFTFLPLDSELLQIGREIKGGTGSGIIESNSGEQYQWAAFSGKALSSYGLSSSIYDLAGMAGGWRSPSGTQLNFYHVNVDDLEDYTGLKGNFLLYGTDLLRFEIIHGASQMTDTSGNGLALHYERPFDISVIGLDYIIYQPGYPEIGSLPVLSASGRGGIYRYGIHGSTIINEQNGISFSGLVTEDTPDQNLNNTIYRKNIYLTHNYHPRPDFSFNTGYQGYFLDNRGDESDKNQNNRLFFNARKTINQSKLQTSFSLNRNQHSDSSLAYDQVHFFSSWDQPFDQYHLIPSFQWTDRQKLNGDSSRMADFRLTMGKRLNSNSAISTLAVFYRINNDTKNADSNETGLTSTLYLNLKPNSAFSLTFDYAIKAVSELPSTSNKRMSLSWKTSF